MPSPTPVLFRSLRRLKLTTKSARKGFYKGNRVGSVGTHTKHGGYIIDWSKVRTYVVPSLARFKLTPFVTNKAPTSRSRPDGQIINVFAAPPSKIPIPDPETTALEPLQEEA